MDELKEHNHTCKTLWPSASRTPSSLPKCSTSFPIRSSVHQFINSYNQYMASNMQTQNSHICAPCIQTEKHKYRLERDANMKHFYMCKNAMKQKHMYEDMCISLRTYSFLATTPNIHCLPEVHTHTQSTSTHTHIQTHRVYYFIFTTQS